MKKLPDETADAPLLAVAKGETRSPVPCWFMRQAGRYLPEYHILRKQAGSFLDLVFTPDLAAEATLQPVRRFDVDGAILFSDILVVPHAMGQALAFVEGEGPRLEPVGDATALGRLSPEGAEEVLAPVAETVRLVRAALPAGKTLIGFAGGPWTVASYMIAGRGGDDQAAAKRWAFADPEGFGRLLDLILETSIAYLLAQVRAGAQMLQIFDSWAGNLPESLFESAVIRPTRRLVERIHAQAPGVPLIGFPRGAGLALGRYADATGVDVVALDTGVPPADADRVLPQGLPVQGNLDPQAVVAGGAAMGAEAKRILAAFAGRPHIFNLGHGLIPDTPPGHVAELVALIRAD